jgi:uncharacterized protein (TIGR02118 family)
MFKVIALLTRKPGISREAFIEYYETRHVPLIRSLFPDIADYRRNYVDLTGAIIADGTTAPDFDSVTELWFPDRKGYDAMLKAHFETDAGERVAKDEENFLDRSKTRFFIVEETGAPAR